MASCKTLSLLSRSAAFSGVAGMYTGITSLDERLALLTVSTWIFPLYTPPMPAMGSCKSPSPGMPGTYQRYLAGLARG